MRVVVTGASQGIGEAIARRFLKDNHDVIGIDTQPSMKIRSIHYAHCVADVSDPQTLPELDDVDILINNAGIQTGTVEDIRVNLEGTMHVTIKYAFQSHIKSVLMIDSASALTGDEFPTYCASKGGVNTYMKCVAKQLCKYGATCNSLSPGGVITSLNDSVMSDPVKWKAIMDVTPLKRWATVEEIAEWAYFITVLNKSCSGQSILIDNLERDGSKFVW